jgi:cytochrome c5
MRWYRTVSWNVGVLSCALAYASLTAYGCDDDKKADADTGHDAAHDADHDANSDEADGSTPHDHALPVGPVTGATCPAGSTVTYDNFAKDFFTNYCLSCHSTKLMGAARNGAPADHNFDTLAAVDLLSAHIDEYAGSGPSSTNTHMPPMGSKAPSMAERQKLSEWIACGVP